jgi:hypothetical protein
LAVVAVETMGRDARADADDELVRRDVVFVTGSYGTLPGRQGALDANFRDNGFTGAPVVWPITGFGVGLAYYRFRFVIDVGWGPSHTLRRWSDGATASYSRRLASVQLGYDFYAAPSFTISPMAGLAVSAFDVSFDPRKPPFAPELVANYRAKDEAGVWSQSFALDLGIGFSSTIPLGDRKRPDPMLGTAAVILGARAGYLVHLHDDAVWHEKEGRGQNAGLPSTPLAGAYAHVTIGFALIEEKYASSCRATSTCRP